MVTPDISFKPLGIVSISLTWLGLLFLIYRFRGTASMSFSLHAAQSKIGQVYYFCLFAITLPLFYVFMIKWFIPALHLPRVSIYLLTVGVVGQLIAVLVPAVGGTKDKVHNFGAYLMAVTLIPMCLILAFANTSIIDKALAIVGVVYMVIASLMYFGPRRLRAYYLYFQAIYIAIFHIIILTNTYTVRAG